jgi:predicted outer membrane protein
MKTGTVVAILLIALAGAGVGLWIWHDWNGTSSASYEPVPLSKDDTTLLLTAYRFLQSQLLADEQAATRGHFEPVRTFARAAAADHRNEANRVKELAARLAPELRMEPAMMPPEFKSGRGAAFDREYLNAFIQNHEQRLENVPPTLPQGATPELGQFAASWTSMLNRHVDASRRLRDGLPRVASNLPLLLLVGIVCVSSACLLKLASPFNCAREPRDSD